MRKTGWMRALCAWLVITVLAAVPVGVPGGSGIVQAAVSDEGYITLYEPYIDGDFFEITWYIEYPDPYDLEVRLYRTPGNVEVPVNPADIHNDPYGGGWYSGTLDPGTYRFELKIHTGGTIQDQVYENFEMPEPEMRTIYFFGTTDPIPDLEIVDYHDNEIVPVSVDPNVDKGYVRYTVEVFPDRCFELDSELFHFSNARELCAANGQDFIVQVSSSEYLLDLYDFDVWMDEDNGIVQGSMLFDRRQDYDGYELRLYDQSGMDYVCQIAGDVEFGWDFSCVLPSNPSYLQVFIIDGSTPHGTNLIIRLDDVELPENFKMVDRKSEPGSIGIEFEFDRISDESDIALYRVYPLEYIPRLIPADGSNIYSGGPWNYQTDSFVHQSVMIRMVDKQGNPFAKTAVFPVVDNISALTEQVDYSAHYLSELDESFEPVNAYFEDTDKTAGGRAGTVEWTFPGHGNLQLFGYDLYYANADDEIIRGEARVYFPNVLPQKFSYELEDVPEAAESLAVVPLLVFVEPVAGGGANYEYYHAKPFYVPLVDRSGARLDQLFVNDEEVFPRQDEPSRYEDVVPWDAEEATVRAVSFGGGVYVDEEGPDSVTTKLVPLSGSTTDVTIRVFTPGTDWMDEYELTIIKEPAPGAPSLTSLVAGGQTVAPVGSLYEVTVPYDTDVVTVTAQAGPDVQISLYGDNRTGSITVAIPVAGDVMNVPIILFDPATQLSAEYTLRIVRQVPDLLVLDVAAGRIGAGEDGYEYRFVPRWMSVGELKAQFVLVNGTWIEVVDPNGGPVADYEPVPAGSTVILTRGEKVQPIKLRMLTDHVKSTLGVSSGPVTLSHIASYAIHVRADVTGDGLFDKHDVRLLLRELH